MNVGVSDVQLVKKLSVEHLPEAGIGGSAVLHGVVKFPLGVALNRVPVVESYAPVADRFENMSAVWKKQSIADIEKDGFERSRHAPSCSHESGKKQKAPVARSRQSWQVSKLLGL
jgi:hypothetical protein